MKSNHTKSTDPHELGYPTPTNFKTSFRLAWSKTKLYSPFPHRVTESQDRKSSGDSNRFSEQRLLFNCQGNC